MNVSGQIILKNTSSALIDLNYSQIRTECLRLFITEIYKLFSVTLLINAT